MCGPESLGLLCGNDPESHIHASLSLYCLSAPSSLPMKNYDPSDIGDDGTSDIRVQKSRQDEIVKRES